MGLAVAVALGGTDHHGADLHGADLHGADLHGADLHAAELHAAELHAADIDPGAIAYARRNLATVGGHVYEGDLYDALPGWPTRPRQRLGRLRAVRPDRRDRADARQRPGSMSPSSRWMAVSDGVGIHRRVAARAPEWLAPGGHLLIETSDRQADTDRGGHGGRRTVHHRRS